jgi:hypothetical protein
MKTQEERIKEIEDRTLRLTGIMDMLVRRLHDSERHEQTMFGVLCFEDCTSEVCTQVREMVSVTGRK